ncbi:ankyrin repeat domain-containing protein [Actinomadura sp. 9N407]|uniref:ankyrin repeat domain-containing protein n=1 Tax=Actinomadura sp. 9N407 TaxID=3375154 RepID=UPI0037B9162A
MIEEATERRLAGDWRGACAAAGFDVGLDLDGVAREHGAMVADRLAADLPWLVPDLVRWHLPRYGGGRTTIAPRQAILLAGYDRIDEATDICCGCMSHTLHVETPSLVEGPQRPRLVFGEVRVDNRNNPLPGRDWTSSRHLWDARRTGELLERCGGGDRAPFFHLDGTPLAADELPAADPGPDAPVAHVEWATLLQDQGETEATLAAAGIFLVGTGQDPNSRLPDLDLLRAGLITPEELHPLVLAALFPDRTPARVPAEPSGDPAPVSARVRCRGEWHEMRVRDGALRDPHGRDEHERERAIRSLGGAVSGCFAVRQAWTEGTGRLPKALRARRDELFLRAQHGDAPGVLRLLDQGADPHVRDGRGRTLLHHIHKLPWEELLPRLLDAGLDLEERDRHGRTPLHLAVGEHGSEELVRALLDAGARIHVADRYDQSVASVIRRRNIVRRTGRTELIFLADRLARERPGVAASIRYDTSGRMY